MQNLFKFVFKLLQIPNMFKLEKITFKSYSVSKKFLNFKMFKFETVRIL
jgi:hypothetical protein